jgi:hypothetical protein
MMEEAKASTLVKGLTPIWEATTLVGYGREAEESGLGVT